MNFDIIGSIVIVKFFNNVLENYNSLLTRTLKKVGVIDRNIRNNDIKDGQFWKVKILKEICENQIKGCFILQPLEYIDTATIIKLVPGMYEELEEDNILFVLPKLLGYNYILPLNLKRLSNHRAVLCVLNNAHA
jgi:hypothetical protein